MAVRSYMQMTGAVRAWFARRNVAADVAYSARGDEFIIRSLATGDRVVVESNLLMDPRFDGEGQQMLQRAVGPLRWGRAWYTAYESALARQRSCITALDSARNHA